MVSFMVLMIWMMRMLVILVRIMKMTVRAWIMIADIAYRRRGCCDRRYARLKRHWS